MQNHDPSLEQQAKEVKELAENINPTDETPDSLAEATTAPLDDDQLGGTVSQSNVDKNKK